MKTFLQFIGFCAVFAGALALGENIEISNKTFICTLGVLLAGAVLMLAICGLKKFFKNFSKKY